MVNDKHVEGGRIDPKAEKRLRRKCDRHVLPPCIVLFLLAFLDRTNIGNAKIQGMTEDLNMKGSDYNTALFIFFIPYILFEVPSNIIIRRFAPSTWLSLIMVCWGVATVGQGFVTNVKGLIAMRFLLGLFEAGLFPGAVYLISMYYKRYELQWRMSLFFSAAIISGAFSGLLAFAIAHMAGVGGFGGWRWIYIIEDIVTVVVGVIAKFWVPNWPDEAAFLSVDERRLLLRRLTQGAEDARMDRLDKRAVKRIVRDWKIYAGTFAYLGVVTTGYSGSFFIPSIIKQMRYTAEASQVCTVPIYLAAAACCLGSAYLADRMRHRYAFTMGGVVVASIGFALLLAQRHIAIMNRYAALFLIVAGGYTTQPITLAWLANTESGHYKRAVASACQIGFGNIGGIVASTVFLEAEAPRYVTGHSVCLGVMWLCATACTVLYLGAVAENKKRERGDRNARLNESNADNLGDDHPSWRLAT